MRVGSIFSKRLVGSVSQALALTAGCVLVVVLVAPAARPQSLLSEPFDSNLPIQWDNSASVDLDGLSRYYSAASAHLRHGAPHGHMALKSLKPAREMSLAQVPTQMLGQDQDWHEQKWSPQHYVNVAASRVDDATAKGIWKSKDEAWSGIDEVLPTDTRYEYQTMHSGHGQEAKMEAFLDHAHHQLKLLRDALPKLAADKQSKKELDTLKNVISVGEDALEKIEHDTIVDDSGKSGAMHPHEMTDEELGLSDKFKVKQGDQLRQMTNTKHAMATLDTQRRAHYENAHASKNEMDSYFTSLDVATQHENRKNARRAGENVGEVHRRDKLALDHSTGRAAVIHMQQLSGDKKSATYGAQHTRKTLQAQRFISALSNVLQPAQVQQLKKDDDSCGMCIAVMGCKDCCELFCAAKSPAASDKPVPKCPMTAGEGGEGGEAVAAADCNDSDSKLEGEVRDLKAQIRSVGTRQTLSDQHAAGSKAARTQCECTTQECTECPDSDYEVRVRREVKAAVNEAEKKEEAKLREGAGKKAGRLPCDCDTADCSNCPRREEVRRRGRSGQDIGAKVVREQRKNRALKTAELAVAKSNAILQERVAALEATNAMAIRQGLGVYGDLSGDDTEWQAREPYPGKSETLGNSVLQPAMDLQKQLFGANREVKLLKSQLAAQQKRSKGAASHRPAVRRRGAYMRDGKANQDILPFFEQPGYGGKNLVKDVQEYRREVANGAAVPY